MHGEPGCQTIVRNVAKDPLMPWAFWRECEEYFLPLIPNLLIQEGKGSVSARDEWRKRPISAGME